MGKVIDYFHHPQMGERIFFAGYILFLWRSVWVTTMFPLSGLMTMVCVPLAALFLGLKILLYDHYPVRQFLLLASTLLCVCLVFLSSGSINPFFWLLLVAASRDVKFEKIVKVYLAVNIAVIFLAFCAASFDVIENLQYKTGKRGIRNSFGIIYPTDFGAHIFFLFLAYYYLKGEALRWYHYAITIAAAGLVYYFCNARLDSGCTLMLAVLYGVGNGIMHSRAVSMRVKMKWELLWRKVGVWAMVLFAVFSVLMTLFYQKDSRAWQELDKIVSSRLRLGNNGIEEYGWTLFGQAIEMVGNGGSTTLPSDYSFIDCSYMYMLLRHGIGFLVLMLAIFTICCYKNRHDQYFLYAMALISVNCVIAHHIIQVEYNPFALALLAQCVREPEGAWSLGHLRWKRQAFHRLNL